MFADDATKGVTPCQGLAASKTQPRCYAVSRPKPERCKNSSAQQNPIARKQCISVMPDSTDGSTPWPAIDIGRNQPEWWPGPSKLSSANGLIPASHPSLAW